MLVPVKWLKEYVDFNETVEAFCEGMILSGSNLETCRFTGSDTEKVVAGKITEIRRHPDADKLLVCRVDAGAAGHMQIVTGASNVFEGAFVPVALDGSVLPGGKTIRSGSLRGEISQGMLCSAGELGFEDKVIPLAHKDGIWILNGLLDPEDRQMEASLGQEISRILDLPDAVVDFEITSNRPDCLCMIGMARETAATFGGTLRYPETACRREAGRAEDYISVEIKRPDLCPRYTARVVTGVKIQDSPWWMQKRLIRAGMRPINNIVDITNYVMLEYGNPLHAFDLDTLEGGAVIVEPAQPGEIFVTLDGTERRLDETVLLIRDRKKTLALAGIMGGENSEIRPETRNILIEAANFNGDAIRGASKKLGLRTEASSRFEKGIDPNLCRIAADRVCALIEELGAGTVAEGAADVYPVPSRPVPVTVRAARVNQILGTCLDGKVMADIFRSLEMTVEEHKDRMTVTPPSVRQDLLEEIDFVEEVARMYGYDRLSASVPKTDQAARKSRRQQLRDLARNTLCALGANEIQTYSFVSPRGVDQIRIPEDSWERNFVRILNPLGEENSVMRTILTPNLLETAGRNFSRNVAQLRCFEIGNTFTANLTDPAELPDEQDSLAAVFYGKEENFFTIKGVLTELLGVLGIRSFTVEAESGYGAYHPGRCARILAGERELGIFGEIHPQVAETYGIAAKVYGAELMFDAVMDCASLEKVYRPLPRFPSVVRDIALLTEESARTGTLEKIIREHGGGLLEAVKLFDVYRGRQVGEGKKSMAFTLTYRAGDRTLTEEEVARVHGGILKALEEQAGASLREL